jgi:hypothetical protein
MEKSSQIAWKLVPLRHFYPLKVVPLIEVLLYPFSHPRLHVQIQNICLLCGKTWSYICCDASYYNSFLELCLYPEDYACPGDFNDYNPVCLVSVMMIINFTSFGEPGVTHKTIPLSSVSLQP